MLTKCPTCDEAIEDDWHWITCDARLACREAQTKTLSGRLSLLETEHSIKIIFLRAFKSVLAAGDYSIPSTDPENLLCQRTGQY